MFTGKIDIIQNIEGKIVSIKYHLEIRNVTQTAGNQLYNISFISLNRKFCCKRNDDVCHIFPVAIYIESST